MRKVQTRIVLPLMEPIAWGPTVSPPMVLIEQEPIVSPPMEPIAWELVVSPLTVLIMSAPVD
jgi:hypothetical protein